MVTTSKYCLTTVVTTSKYCLHCSGYYFKVQLAVVALRPAAPVHTACTAVVALLAHLPGASAAGREMPQIARLPFSSLHCKGAAIDHPATVILIHMWGGWRWTIEGDESNASGDGGNRVMTKTKMTLLTTTVMAEQELCSKAFIRCIQGAGSSNHTLVHSHCCKLL